MSVDYMPCNYCGDIFPDCGEYVSCNEDCYNVWCSYECAEEDGFIDEHCEKFPDLCGRDEMKEYRSKNCNYTDCDRCPDYRNKSCKYCRHEDYTDDVLLEKALEILKISRDELIGIIKESNNEL